MKRRVSQLVGFLLAAAPVTTVCAEGDPATKAIAVETTDAVFDGKTIGRVAAGTTVVIMGEKKEEGLSLIRFKSREGDDKLGLVPTSALVERKPDTASAAAPANSATKPAAPSAALDLEQELTATQLAEYLESNRAEFPSLAGKMVKVGGVVEDLRVIGNVGSMVTAEITLKTRPDLPKIRLMVHASEFMDNSKGDRFEMRVQGKTLEGRSRDTRYPYNYWYWYNGYWRSRSVARSEWVPIISIGQPLQGTGALGKYHINVDVEGARINKG